MCRFIETIRIRKGMVCNLVYHNLRMNRVRREVFGLTQPLDLADYIDCKLSDDVVKCRVVYDAEVCEVSYAPYLMRRIDTLKLVYDDEIDYRYKSTDRTSLNSLYACRGDEDDVLIVRNRLLTDISIANVALEKDGNWYTPASPLLKGTQRAALLNEGIVKEQDILVDDLYSFTRIAVFNAMIEFGSLVLDINPATIRKS